MGMYEGVEIERERKKEKIDKKNQTHQIKQ